MVKYKSKWSARILLVVAVIIGVVTPLLGTLQHTDAAAFTQAYVRLDRLTEVAFTSGRVCVKPATAPGASGNKIQVTFPTTAATDYIVSATLTDWTTNTTFETGFGGTAMPITTATQATSVSGKVVTWAITGNLTVGTLYCFNWTNSVAALKTGSAGAAISGGNFGSVQTLDTGNAVKDQSYWGATLVTAGNDQVTVTGQVVPYFTMVLSGITDNWSAPLATGSVNTSTGRSITVDTNALNGWYIWARGTNSRTVTGGDTGVTGNLHGALRSTTAAYSMGNNTTNGLLAPNAKHAFVAGTEDYGLAVTLGAQTSGGARTLDPAYNGTTAGEAGIVDVGQFRPIVASAGFAQASIVNIKMVATVSVTTPPATDYTDIMIYTGAGQF